MPTYEYQCERGHRFEVQRPVAERDDPVYCPEGVVGDHDFYLCDTPARRVLSTPASSFPGADAWRKP